MVIIHAGTPTRSMRRVSGAIVGNPLITPTAKEWAPMAEAANAAGRCGAPTSNR
jgi:hypothetical protein